MASLSIHSYFLLEAAAKQVCTSSLWSALMNMKFIFWTFQYSGWGLMSNHTSCFHIFTRKDFEFRIITPPSTWQNFPLKKKGILLSKMWTQNIDLISLQTDIGKQVFYSASLTKWIGPLRSPPSLVRDIEGVAVVRGEIGWSGGSYAENHLLSKGEIWQHKIWWWWRFHDDGNDEKLWEVMMIFFYVIDVSQWFNHTFRLKS